MTTDGGNDLEPNVAGFDQRKNFGHRAEAWAATLLRYRGLNVYMDSIRVRRGREPRSEWLDERDLYVSLRRGGPELCVEVKGRPTMSFTRIPKSYPHPSAIIYREGKGYRPWGVVIVSGVTWHCVCAIPDGSEWVEVVPDHERGYSTRNFLFARDRLIDIDIFCERLQAELLEMDGGA